MSKHKKRQGNIFHLENLKPAFLFVNPFLEKNNVKYIKSCDLT